MSRTMVEPVEPLTPERRREMTREHLLAAAMRVFARQGYHGASIDDIAAAAGFTKGAVYSNFESKEDLFFAVLDERSRRDFAAVRAGLEEADALPEEERPALHTRLTAEMLWGDEDWMLLFLEFTLYAARNPHARRRLAERYRLDHDLLVPIVEGGVARSGAKSPVPIDVLTSIFLALTNGIALRHVTDPEGADETLLASAIELLNRSIGLPPATDT